MSLSFGPLSLDELLTIMKPEFTMKVLQTLLKDKVAFTFIGGTTPELEDTRKGDIHYSAKEKKYWTILKCTNKQGDVIHEEPIYFTLDQLVALRME